ncbi:LSU ribosomal protein L3P [Halobacillus alkaliphilus]|uniref:Large ribosomal subunit protein uL3 n=2 Tax=Halobacillus TaxID=45667 RepID=I0JH93_HALH3|nr:MULTISPECIES: 50S ribosomal protein L3 [Halobacillus]ASF37734.1 50S ribosomal protein L3 [Halobacillus halophilus]CCG43511.1 50S ribosomal protein L3 [Halobacillus halophilus DSM 2266]SFG11080.1 LSU ribosomal protein L3P [Halobacillus alkaliphilus]
MTKGILGRKVGMTQIFSEDGELIPVTVVQAEPNVVLQKKTTGNDGYEAIQLGFADEKSNRLKKAAKGHAEKANTTPKRYVREFRNANLDDYELGQEVKVDIFEAGDVIDVTGTSKGKGFQGAIKRHNQSTGPMTHGSRYHRRPGTMGPIDPNHVLKGKKLPGQMGSETVTLQNLEVVRVDAERNLLLIKGNVPGAKKSYVKVSSAIKASK